MKLLCIISAFIVVLLSVRPCCADDCASKKTETTQSAHSSSPKEKDCAGCSPFFSCGSCAGFVVTKAISYIIRPNAEPFKHLQAYQQPYLEEIASSIWQPPQSV